MVQMGQKKFEGRGWRPAGRIGCSPGATLEGIVIPFTVASLWRYSSAALLAALFTDPDCCGSVDINDGVRSGS